MRTSQKSATMSARCSLLNTWKSVLQKCSMDWDFPIWGAALWERTWWTKLSMSDQWAAVAQRGDRRLGGIKGITSRDDQAVILLWSVQVQPHLESFVQYWSLLYKMEGLEKTTKMIKGLGILTCEERLRELGLFSLEKRKALGILYHHIAVFKA